MNLRPVYALLLLSSLAELSGCKDLFKKKDTDPASSAAPVAVPPAVIAPLPTTPPVAEVAAPAGIDEKAVPTPQDFEDEAFEKVTAANFKAQFAALKTEISK